MEVPASNCNQTVHGACVCAVQGETSHAIVSNEPNQTLNIEEGPPQGNGGRSDNEGPNWTDGWNQVELCTLQRNDPNCVPCNVMIQTSIR